MEQRRDEGMEETGDPEKTHRPAAQSGTIPTCENPGVIRPGLEPGSPWWGASRLTAQPPWPLQALVSALTGSRELSSVLFKNASLFVINVHLASSISCARGVLNVVRGTEVLQHRVLLFDPKSWRPEMRSLIAADNLLCPVAPTSFAIRDRMSLVPNQDPA
ncbi:hypothetical protein PR048_024283 [Dryococelus australis]|uniref:Uncharacterized protein n=1 Tax=Dryococelus australis TaxID=614101 RepID=A0ABQ9GN52_9NEOP|nr:hypothetical protein PR048_024283 [Dryococelus australis]